MTSGRGGAWRDNERHRRGWKGRKMAALGLAVKRQVAGAMAEWGRGPISHAPAAAFTARPNAAISPTSAKCN